MLTRDQGLDQMFVRLESHDYPAGQYDLTSGCGAFNKNAFSISTNVPRGVCGGGFDTGITLPAGMVQDQVFFQIYCSATNPRHSSKSNLLPNLDTSLKNNTDAWCVEPDYGPNIFMTAGVDFGAVLRIVTSDSFLHLRITS